MTIFLLLAASGLNTAVASSAFCPDLPESSSLSTVHSKDSSAVKASDESELGSSHQDSSDHSSSATHHCHLGHCQYLISTNSITLPTFTEQSFYFDIEQLNGVAHRKFHRPPCS